ncbi:hypothetical protein [Streptomyces sp. NPDC046332]|uniref:hypothetical protein n=1 Tax=unclassified Streptomyces TaxID=2593676 RepID=UPI0034105285
MTDPTPAEQLLNLADRAERHGGLTAEEAGRLRSGLIVMAQRLTASRQLNDSLGRQLTQAEAKLERVRALHQPMARAGFTICARCSGWNGVRCLGLVADYPCDTIAALDEQQEQQPTPPSPVHIGNRANAEDCPACKPEIDKTVLYPWICPGA